MRRVIVSFSQAAYSPLHSTGHLWLPSPSRAAAFSPARRSQQALAYNQRRAFHASKGRLDAGDERAAGPKRTRESIIPQTYYDFFPESLGSDPIPPSGPFEIDVRTLRREFLKLQSKAHPDLAPPDRKREAEGLSARINEAYKTLQNPLLRAQYLLSLKGIDVAGDETAKVEDSELLMDVLDARETIEEAEEESDLDDVRSANDGRIEESVKELSEAFAVEDTERAQREAIKLRYWINIKESVDAWEKGKPVVLIH